MSGTKSFTYDNILIEFNTEALVHICTTLAEISDLSFFVETAKNLIVLFLSKRDLPIHFKIFLFYTYFYLKYKSKCQKLTLHFPFFRNVQYYIGEFFLILKL